MNDTPPRKRAEGEGHPIRLTIARVLRDGGRGQEPARLDRVGATKIAQEIDALLGTEELVEAVEMVIAIAHALQTRKRSPRTARRLLDIVERDKVIASLKELNRIREARRAEAVRKAAEKFSDFTDTELLKRAPRGNEKAPRGSMKLGSLAFPKRL